MHGEMDRSRAIFWGAALIIFGILLLTAQQEMWELRIGNWWPAVLVALGLNEWLKPGDRRQIASGLTWILMALMFWACTYHWYGLTYRKGWPLFLVIFGLSYVVSSITGDHDRRARRRAQRKLEKAEAQQDAAGKEQGHVDSQ